MAGDRSLGYRKIGSFDVVTVQGKRVTVQVSAEYFGTSRGGEYRGAMLRLKTDDGEHVEPDLDASPNDFIIHTNYGTFEKAKSTDADPLKPFRSP